MEENPRLGALLATVAGEIPLLPFYRLQLDAFVSINKAVRILKKSKDASTLKAIDAAIQQVGWGTIAN
ncbi:MAG: hypothetical protein Q7V20_00165, partial [Aquabacterium sp.]|uniref:hypothetical protein n=1 Tax=Aquabacterium sp. TaxID=1872578 RepID=UPI0027260E06